jgi:ppGpp synthetase/RelA/SpoT-type nucleotidyltranferase
MHKEQILEEFLSAHDALCAHGEALRARIEALLAARGIMVHLVSGRVKSLESLRHKLSRPDRSYEALWSVTDLVGLRITTYFEDAIDAVARAIEEAFAVDYNDSIDKLRFKDHGRFGYRSLHYVCALPGDAAIAPLPPAARFEIQVRTVVQHAWAEVEHDLGYKSHDAVPERIRRRFSRVASLLEIADEEFVSIRRELESYQRAVADGALDADRSFPLDAVSLHAVSHGGEVNALDEAIAGILGRRLSGEVFFPEYLVRMLRLSGLGTTRDLYAALRRHRDDVTAMVRPYFEYTATAWRLTAASLDCVHRGYSLFFLSHVVIVRSPDLGLSKVSKLTQLYRELDYPDDERAAQRVASDLLAALTRA